MVLHPQVNRGGEEAPVQGAKGPEPQGLGPCLLSQLHAHARNDARSAGLSQPSPQEL